MVAVKKFKDSEGNTLSVVPSQLSVYLNFCIYYDSFKRM